MLLSIPEFSTSSPAPATRSSRLVWQERYEGVAVVAYEGGKAIAGISGPWSNRFVLTWWQPNPNGQLEIFDTLDAAKQAVEAASGTTECKPIEIPAVRMPRPSLWTRLFGAPSRDSEHNVDLLRQRAQREYTDFSGLHFSAIAD